METVRLLYPDWLVIGVIIFLIILIFIGITFFCVSIKFLHGLNTCSSDIYFISDVDGDNLINIDKIEQVTKRYNIISKEYEIIYFLKSGHEIKETFETSNNCSLRFMEINDILNNFNC